MSLEKKIKHYRAAQKEVCNDSQSCCKIKNGLPNGHASKHIAFFICFGMIAFMKGCIIGYLISKSRNK